MSESSYTAAELAEIKKIRIRQKLHHQLGLMIDEQNGKEGSGEKTIRPVVKERALSGSEISFSFDEKDVQVGEGSFYSEREEKKATTLELHNDFDKAEHIKREEEKLIKEFRDFSVTDLGTELKQEKDAILQWIGEFTSSRANKPEDSYQVIEERIGRFYKKAEELENTSEKSYEYLKKEYDALCRLLREEPKDEELTLSKDGLKRKCEILLRRLEFKREKEYVQDSLQEVLEALGYDVENILCLEEGSEFEMRGEMYASPALAGSKLFTTYDQGQMVLETIADDVFFKNREDTIKSSAKSICSHKKEIQRLLAEEKGVYIRIDGSKEPDLGAMYQLSAVRREDRQELIRRREMKKERERMFGEYD